MDFSRGPEFYRQSTPMDRAVGIKVDTNFKEFMRMLEFAKTVTGGTGIRVEQCDVYYDVRVGRLKLRFETDSSPMLMQYTHQELGTKKDTVGPKLTKYDVLKVHDPEVIHRMLANSLDILGEVRKVRHTFEYRQCHIHVDRVEGIQLGYFVKIEVRLRPEQLVQRGMELIQEMRKEFAVSDQFLSKWTYLDKLLVCANYNNFSCT